MENVVVVVGFVASVLGIIGCFMPINKVRARWIHAVYIVIVSLVVCFATYQSTQLARKDAIARAADQLVKDKEFNYTNRGYVFAVLTFLEKNKDLFPETYKRAVYACATFKCNDPKADVDMVDLSSTLDGIVKGLSTLSR